MRKWMDKGAAKAERGTPAPRGVKEYVNNRRQHVWRQMNEKNSTQDESTQSDIDDNNDKQTNTRAQFLILQLSFPE